MTDGKFDEKKLFNGKKQAETFKYFLVQINCYLNKKNRANDRRETAKPFFYLEWITLAGNECNVAENRTIEMVLQVARIHAFTMKVAPRRVGSDPPV